MIARLAPFIALTLGCATKGWVKEQLATSHTVTTAYVDSSVNTAVAKGQATRASDIDNLKSQLGFQQSEIDSLKTQFHAVVSTVGTTVRFALPINFAFDDATVSESDHAALDRFASVVGKFYGGSMVTVEGFADPAGSQAYNIELSKRRADNVAQYLTSKGLDAEHVKTVGYGKARPVHPDASHDEPGAAQNRRAVFVVETAPEGQPMATSAANP